MCTTFAPTPKLASVSSSTCARFDSSTTSAGGGSKIERSGSRYGRGGSSRSSGSDRFDGLRRRARRIAGEAGSGWFRRHDRRAVERRGRVFDSQPRALGVALRS